MALICNKVQKSLYIWWGEVSWNGRSPQVHCVHCLIDPGPPGPPDKVAVEEITDSTAQLSWTPGRDNGSPITGYIIQARTPFTVGWQAVDTGTMKHSCPFVVFIRVLMRVFIYLSFNFSPVVGHSDFLKNQFPLCSAGGGQRQHADSHSGGSECLGGVRVQGGGPQYRRPGRAQPGLSQDQDRGCQYVKRNTSLHTHIDNSVAQFSVILKWFLSRNISHPSQVFSP